MICKVCLKEFDEAENVSPLEGYPVCKECKGEIECDKCGNTGRLFYDADEVRVLCTECLIEVAENKGFLKTSKVYYDKDWGKIGDDDDYGPIADYLVGAMALKEAEV